MYTKKPQMKAQDVIELYRLCETNNIKIWIDGGWGVDALLSKQTRPHGDLDIAVKHKDVSKLRQLLGARGYAEVLRDDSRECNFVLSDDKGHQVDVHSFELDENGNNTFGVAYEEAHFGGEGMINGRKVTCINPKTLVEFHTGYPLDEDDHKDVMALCAKFSIGLPEEHIDWEQRQRILRLIRSFTMPQSRPLIIAVSGFGGSGKTTLANVFKTQLKDAKVVGIDSFSTHEWRRNADWDNFDRSRFKREILQPARANNFPLIYAHEPWPGHVADPAVKVPATKHLIVEGCSIFHPDLLKYYDYKVWVDCPLEEATKRGMWRDRHVHKDEQDNYWQNIWMPNERDFYEKYHPDQATDEKYDSSIR